MKPETYNDNSKIPVGTCAWWNGRQVVTIATPLLSIDSYVIVPCAYADTGKYAGALRPTVLAMNAPRETLLLEVVVYKHASDSVMRDIRREVARHGGTVGHYECPEHNY